MRRLTGCRAAPALATVALLVACGAEQPEQTVTSVVWVTASPSATSSSAAAPASTSSAPTTPAPAPTVATAQPAPSAATVTVTATATPSATPSASTSSPSSSTASAAPSTTTASGTRTYTNDRFGLSVELPASLQEGQAPANGDGVQLGDSGGALVRVYGSNVTGAAPTRASVVAEVSRSRPVQYQAGTDRAFSVSWLDEAGNVRYQRYLVGSGSYAVLDWTYPQTRKAELDPALTRSVKSFRASGLDSAH